MTSLKKILLLGGALGACATLQAQAPVPDAMEDPFVVIMVVIIIILALIIGLLAWVVLGSAQFYLQRYKKEETTEKKSTGAGVAASVVALLLVAQTGRAEEAGETVIVKVHAISDTTFYPLVGVIFLELVVIGALLYNLWILLEIKRRKVPALAGQPAKPVISWWDRLNKFRPIEHEVDLDLGHDYDGIRELDNRLPPWWLYGFYLTIIFAGIYLWRYHVSHTAPGSIEEYQLAIKEAEVKRAAYLKKAANNVDENTVKLLTGTEDITAGEKVYSTTCFPCHGKLGEGGVGPNLTDNYWLHGGSVNEIFKTIKYGVPEKGMKSWKDDYSPSQIAQIASYIKSLRGTNPPNAKAPQGTLHEEAKAGTIDSTAAAPAGQ